MINAGVRRPCCQLRLSLYGHPQSGKYLGNHFTQKVLSVEFEGMKSWECLFIHRELKLILCVYVDDFKLVGKKDHLETGWKLMRQSGLVLDDPAPLGDYLGCGQFPILIAPEEAQRRLEHTRPLLENTIDEIKALTGSPPKPVRAIRYNMFGFFKQCV